MTILVFVRKHFDGKGDIVHAAEITKLIEKLLREKRIEDNIIICVPDTNSEYNHKEIVGSFLENPKTQVKTLSEIMQTLPTDIRCGIEVAYNASFWQEKLGEHFKSKNIPVIYAPEYNMIPFKKVQLAILGGFNQKGVITNPHLLQATADSSLFLKEVEKLFNQLGFELKKYLGNGNFESFLKHRESHEFSYQYSHDNTVYKACNKEGRILNRRTPVEFFLREHIAIKHGSTHSQDILCIGGTKEIKKSALQACKQLLIENKYTKITFVDVKEGKQDVIYDEPTQSHQQEYRLLFLHELPYRIMKWLALLTKKLIGGSRFEETGLIGGTGDHSFVEGLAASLVSYECMRHKTSFALGYVEQVSLKAKDEKVIMLAKFLIKANLRADAIYYDEQEALALLKDKNVVNALVKINREILEESKYCEMLGEMILSLYQKEAVASNERNLPKKESFSCLEKTLKTKIFQLKEASLHLLEITNDPTRGLNLETKANQSAKKIYGLIQDKITQNKRLAFIDFVTIYRLLNVVKENKELKNDVSSVVAKMEGLLRLYERGCLSQNLLASKSDKIDDKNGFKQEDMIYPRL